MLGEPLLARLGLASALLLGACTHPPPNPTSSPSTPPPQAKPAMPDITEIAPDQPLRAGHVAFQGMVRPTKGGYEVRGAILDDDALPKALADAPGASSKDPEWFLGAVVRVACVVREHSAEPTSDDGLVQQTRAGQWLEVERIESASVVEPAEVVEGTLARSKGFFAVGRHLVSQDDIAWSLGPQGAKEGDRVRLHGQPRTVVCEPDAQCLIDGSLPLFDVGRAERLP